MMMTTLAWGMLPTLFLSAELDVGPNQPYGTMQSAADAAAAGDVIRVHPGMYAEDLSLTGSGTGADPIRIEAVSEGDAVLEGTIDLDGDHWEIVGMVVQVSGDRDGIRLRGNDNLILRMDLSGGSSDGIDGSGTRNEVRESVIHLFDAGGGDAHCIVLNPGAQGWRIVENELFDCSGDGVQLFADGAERSIVDTTIEGNLIYYTGAIGRTENAIDVKNADGLFIRNNVMWGFPDNKTLVFQKGPANIEVLCNSMSEGFTGVEFRGEDGGTVENIVFAYNLLFGYEQYGLKFDGTVGGDVWNNTLVDIAGDGLRFEGGSLEEGLVQNNLFVDVDQVEGDFSGTADHNGFFQVGDNQIGSDSDVEADPLLDGEQRLMDQSPMIDAGVDVGFMFEGSAPDIGWDERDGDPCGSLPDPGEETGLGDDGSSGTDGDGDAGENSGTSGTSGGGQSQSSGCGCRSADPRSLVLLTLLVAAIRRRSDGVHEPKPRG